MAIGWSEVLIKAVFVVELTIGVPMMCVTCVGTTLINFACPVLRKKECYSKNETKAKVLEKYIFLLLLFIIVIHT